MIRGKKDLGVLFTAVYSSLSDLRWTGEFKDGDRGCLTAEARLGPFQIYDATVFELDSGGRIQRLSPHLRPWLATTWFALDVGFKLVGHPGVIWRAKLGS